MTDKKKGLKAQKLDDEAVEQISGGAARGFFSAYSDEKYREAGVEVIGPGDWYNDGYRLMASGEDLTADLANLAVMYYDKFGVQVWSKEEIQWAFKTNPEYR